MQVHQDWFKELDAHMNRDESLSRRASRRSGPPESGRSANKDLSKSLQIDEDYLEGNSGQRTFPALLSAVILTATSLGLFLGSCTTNLWVEFSCSSSRGSSCRSSNSHLVPQEPSRLRSSMYVIFSYRDEREDRGQVVLKRLEDVFSTCQYHLCTSKSERSLGCLVHRDVLYSALYVRTFSSSMFMRR